MLLPLRDADDFSTSKSVQPLFPHCSYAIAGVRNASLGSGTCDVPSRRHADAHISDPAAAGTLLPFCVPECLLEAAF